MHIDITCIQLTAASMSPKKSIVHRKRGAQMCSTVHHHSSSSSNVHCTAADMSSHKPQIPDRKTQACSSTHHHHRHNQTSDSPRQAFHHISPQSPGGGHSGALQHLKSIAPSCVLPPAVKCITPVQTSARPSCQIYCCVKQDTTQHRTMTYDHRTQHDTTRWNVRHRRHSCDVSEPLTLL